MTRNLYDRCPKCGGYHSLHEHRRLDSWTREKHYLGLDHPAADKNTGNEKWPRFCSEIPPELAAELDTAIKRVSLSYTRAAAVRSALRLWLEHNSPELDPAIDGTAEEIINLPTIEETVGGTHA
jgi:hypothetical protein